MEKKKLLKNKIVDTLPVLYLETVILMVLGQFLGNFVLGIPVGIAYARNPEILNSAFLNTTLMYVIFLGNLGRGIVLDRYPKTESSDFTGSRHETTGK